MKTFSVFISSTIEDLKSVRSNVDEEIAGMEIFNAVRVENLPAVDEDSRNVCLKGVADADTIVIIICERYGYIPPHKNPENLSVTHLEYREAKRLKKPIFVFIKSGVAQEESLQKFAQEVSDFDGGVFRKTWENIATLREEVRRTLLFWLARLARERKPNETNEEWVEKLYKYPELKEIQTLFKIDISKFKIDISNSTSKTNTAFWIDEVSTLFSDECRKRYLPSPKIINEKNIEPTQVAIELSIHNNSHRDRLDVTLRIIPPRNTESPKNHIGLPFGINVAKTHNGALFLSKCVVALTFLAIDDWSKGIDCFLDASNDTNATQKVSALLVGEAAYISASNRGQRSHEIVKKMLGLKYIDGPTVSAGTMALIATELRLENARAKHALFETEKLFLQLLLYALESDQASPDTLYNLSRKLLRHSNELALVFYSELVSKDSSYDERWYYHRDLGLIHYDLNNYQEAGKNYDKACHLKPINSELFRFAGDAYYYCGMWYDALLRYEQAIKLEPIENYFLDQKVAFCQKQISRGLLNNKYFLKKKTISYRISNVADKIAKAGYSKLSTPLFTLSKCFFDLNYYSDGWLALCANRKIDFKKAISHLFCALAVRPEDPSTRLNLVMNMIFLEDGQFTDNSREHMKITIFHGGPITREQFALRLINTDNKTQLIAEFDELFEIVKKEREAWTIRRKEILKPEKFGEIFHVEFRE